MEQNIRPFDDSSDSEEEVCVCGVSMYASSLWLDLLSSGCHGVNFSPCLPRDYGICTAHWTEPFSPSWCKFMMLIIGEIGIGNGTPSSLLIAEITVHYTIWARCVCSTMNFELSEYPISNYDKVLASDLGPLLKSADIIHFDLLHTKENNRMILFFRICGRKKN